MTQWEYEVVQQLYDGTWRCYGPVREEREGADHEVLARLGAEGWELVSVTRTEDVVRRWKEEALPRLYFKRPVEWDASGDGIPADPKGELGL